MKYKEVTEIIIMLILFILSKTTELLRKSK